MALNSKQQLFVNEYLKCFNATEAYIASYPNVTRTTAASNGYDLLRNTEISKAISQRLSDTAMSADEVIRRLGEHARGSIAPFIKQREGDEDITVDLTTPQAQANLHLIKKVTQRRIIRTRGEDEEIEDTTLSIELYPADGALNTLAKHHGLLTDKMESTINNFDIDYSKLTTGQLQRISKGENVLKVIIDGYISSRTGES